VLIKAAANISPEIFPEPKKVKIDRPDSQYIHFGWGTHACFGAPFATIGLTAMLRCFAVLPNLRRAPGLEGQLKYVVMGLFRVYMTQEWSNYSYWPTGAHLLSDANR
jgi:prostaglandin-endoperoxide synthase 2/linoleate 10R-lipoxygenase